MKYFNYPSAVRKLVLVSFTFAWVNASVLAQTWNQTGSPSNFWKSVASSADGTRLVAVAGMGIPSPIYTSTNSGLTWISNNAPRMDWNTVVSSRDGKRLVAAVGPGSIGGVYTNSGTDWGNSGLEVGDWQGVAMSSNGSRIYAAGTAYTRSGLVRGIYVSAGVGAPWTRTTAPDQPWYSIFCSLDGAKVFAVSGAGLWRSTDAGATWIKVPGAPGMQSISGSTNGAVLVGAASALHPIYYSSDFGITWSSNNSCMGNWTSVASSEDGTRFAAATAYAGIYTSSDPGAVWELQLLPTSSPCTAVAMCADGTRCLAAVSWGPVYACRVLPALTVSKSSDAAAISWPMSSAAAGLSLEASDSLLSNGWRAVTNSVGTNNGQYEVIVPIPGPQTYFRLKGI